jgi:hypothetical protein
MARITVQFFHPTDDSDLALIPVEVSNDQGNIIYNQAVPLSTNAELNYDFKPGSYLVRGSLPSGEFAACTVDLTNTPSAVAVLRSHTQSPRESLSWAYYLQRAPVRSVAKTERTGVFELSELNSKLSLPPIPPVTNFWRHSAEGWTQFPVAQGLPRQGFFTYVNYDWSVQAQEPDAMLFIELNSELSWQYNLGQFWIQVVSGLHSQFVSVPPAQKMRIYIVNNEPGNEFEPPFRVIVGSGTPTMQSLVGFLASGDFDSARSVGDQWLIVAEKMLKEKLEDAVAAAVAGYFLLRVGEHSRLHDWTRNLADWITWLPDGPVIRAFHVLSQKDPDMKEVRERLLQAVERGIPLYTQGLRMLFDGLNMLNTRAGGKDPLLQQALQNVRPYAATARWNSPVTSFTAIEPSHPQFPELAISRYAPAGEAVRVPA